MFVYSAMVSSTASAATAAPMLKLRGDPVSRATTPRDASDACRASQQSRDAIAAEHRERELHHRGRAGGDAEALKERDRVPERAVA